MNNLTKEPNAFSVTLPAQNGKVFGLEYNERFDERVDERVGERV